MASGKDISQADEPVVAALRDAAQAAFPGSRLQLCAYTNLAGYSQECVHPTYQASDHWIISLLCEIPTDAFLVCGIEMSLKRPSAAAYVTNLCFREKKHLLALHAGMRARRRRASLAAATQTFWRWAAGEPPRLLLSAALCTSCADS